jgi:hypothetical protein
MISTEFEMKDDRLSKLSDAITRFVENPLTNLVKGVALLLIGLSEASKTFREDLAHGTARVGHGLIIIGFFSILSALPHFLDGLEAYKQYIELERAKKERSGPGPDHGPEEETIP